jgi:hypothetical protein
VIFRLAWVFLGATHAPALLAGMRQLVTGQLPFERLLPFCFLALSMLFFVLKILDVRWLRVRVTRQSFIAMLVIVALMHVHVVRGESQPTPAIECVAMAAATWLALGVPVVRRRLRSWLACAASSLGHSPASSRVARTLWQDTVHPHCWFLAYRLFLYRAPPFAAQ